VPLSFFHKSHFPSCERQRCADLTLALKNCGRTYSLWSRRQQQLFAMDETHHLNVMVGPSHYYFSFASRYARPAAKELTSRFHVWWKLCVWARKERESEVEKALAVAFLVFFEGKNQLSVHARIPLCLKDCWECNRVVCLTVWNFIYQMRLLSLRLLPKRAFLRNSSICNRQRKKEHIHVARRVDVYLILIALCCSFWNRAE
jgi:hypothetical protein